MFFTVRTESARYTLSGEELDERITSCDETFSDICSHYNTDAGEALKILDDNQRVPKHTSFLQLIFILEGNWEMLAQYDEGELR